MPRFLVMSERAVTDLERVAYLQTLAVRRERAAAASANFWVFEQLDRRGNFLEFVEAGAADSLATAVAAVANDTDGGHQQSAVWREVRAPNQLPG